jgi:anti-sigma-K factor RskA
MTCDELKDVFELYSLGLLEGEEREEVDAHLARGCDNCQKNLREALALNALMLASTPPITPPSRLKHRLPSSVGIERSGWGWLYALAAACMLVLALWLSVQERRRSNELADARRTILSISAERDRLAQAFVFLNQPETRQVNFGGGQPQPPRGNIFVNSRLGVMLIGTNLPQLPAGRAYEMWIIPKGGMPRPAGLFQSDAQSSALHILSGPIDTSMVAAVAVSVEPATGSPAPSTTPIIVAATPGA